MAYNEQTVLEIVKARLNRLASDTSMDSYLKQRIQAAENELSRTGIILALNVEDALFLADYAVWKYQNRDQVAGMPDWLRLARRERWVSQKGRAIP